MGFDKIRINLVENFNDLNDFNDFDKSFCIQKFNDIDGFNDLKNLYIFYQVYQSS